MVNDIPLKDQIECVRRELGMRKRVYPRWIREGRMTHEEADHQMARMEAVLRTLDALPPVPLKEATELQLLAELLSRHTMSPGPSRSEYYVPMLDAIIRMEFEAKEALDALMSREAAGE